MFFRSKKLFELTLFEFYQTPPKCWQWKDWGTVSEYFCLAIRKIVTESISRVLHICNFLLYFFFLSTLLINNWIQLIKRRKVLSCTGLEVAEFQESSFELHAQKFFNSFKNARFLLELRRLYVFVIANKYWNLKWCSQCFLENV